MNCDKNMSVGDGTVMAEDKIVFTGCKHAYLVMLIRMTRPSVRF